MAERAGHATPRRMQALLAEHAWDWTAALKALQQFIAARLGDPEAIMVLDETAELKKGDRTVGVARQHAGITGQVENCQTVVFAAYVTGRAHALFDFRLYLPRSWCLDARRRQRAHVPDEVAFTTKPALGTAMLTGAASAGVPFAWAAADEVYGRSSKLREACEKDNKGYVVAVPVNFTVTLPSGRRRNACSRERGRQDSIRTRPGPGTPSTATPSCPCAPRPCWPLPQPARPRPLPSHPVPARTSSPWPGATPASYPPAPATAPPAMTPAWSRSAPPRPAAWPASRPRRSAEPPATWATPGHDGDAATRPAPDGTTTTPSYSKPPTSPNLSRRKEALM